ncbi:restriction endonuclease subunit S [Streptomyces pseudogriseolus]|uniref:restriction endonuclease subunit S n=1 Tax=Streptomyces pseudogriseolus TaxID=36817 RepID=UPI003FA283CB
MSIPSELPEGWAWATLGDIADSTLGKMLDRKKGGDHPVPYLRNVNVQWGRIGTEDVLTMSIPPEQQDSFRVRRGDLLVCEGGEVGRCAVFEGDDSKYIAFQKALHRVRPLGGISSHYLRYYFEYLNVTGGFERFTTGSTIKHLPQQQLKRLPVRVPPLEEQQRIVAALEEQLSRLDAATGSAMKALKSADALIHSVKAQAIRDLEGNYPNVMLAEEIREPLRNGHSARAAAGGTIRTLTLTAVTKGLFDDAHTKMTAADPARISKLWLKPGDILIQRSNTPDLVGTSALYEGPEDWAIFPDLLIRVRTSERLDPRFAHLVLSSPQTRRYYRSRAKGLAGSMPKIDQETILNTRIPLPDLEVQRQTVEAVTQVVERARRAASTAEAYRAKSSALRRSLLAESFAGRLVPQDPADEPAEALLTRIRAEREAAGAAKPRRRSPRRAPAQGKQAPDTAPAPDAPPPPRADAPALATATQPTLDLEIPS